MEITLFISPEENFGIVIESKEIADMLRNTFDLAWEEAKRLDKKIVLNIFLYSVQKANRNRYLLNQLN